MPLGSNFPFTLSFLKVFMITKSPWNSFNHKPPGKSRLSSRHVSKCNFLYTWTCSRVCEKMMPPKTNPSSSSIPLIKLVDYSELNDLKHYKDKTIWFRVTKTPSHPYLYMPPAVWSQLEWMESLGLDSISKLSSRERHVFLYFSKLKD